MGHALGTIALGPLLVAQGCWVRRRVPKLSEPPGARAGVAGSGPELRLLIVGDSAAAGVGASHQREALSGRLVDALASRYRVDWRLEAHTGATTRAAIECLATTGLDACDVVLTSVGLNDVTAGVPLRTFLRDQRELRGLLFERFGARRQVVCDLPPVGRFPALPQPLRGWLGSKARRFARDLRQDVERDPRCSFLELDGIQDLRAMASDGYHPGPTVFAWWGAAAAERIVSANERAARESSRPIP